MNTKVVPASHSLCPAHLLRNQQLRRNNARTQPHPGINGGNTPARRNAKGVARHGAKAAPVQFSYHNEGVAVTASLVDHAGMTPFSLTALLQTFLTSLTWLCPINSSSTEGWLTLTLSTRESLWRVTRSGSDGSSLRLIPVSGDVPSALRSAADRFAA